VVDRDGVGIAWEVYGRGEPTIAFLPTWMLVHSRCWKAQIPYFARHARVVVWDPRGNGKSDRPREERAHTEAEFAQDALAVFDATGTDKAVLVSLSRGAQLALLLCAEHPERVAGSVFVAPMAPLSPLAGLRWRLMAHPRMRNAFERAPLTTASWAKFNAQHWRDDYGDFVEWFIRRVFPEPHSTKPIEDGIAWGLDTDGETLAASARGLSHTPFARRHQAELARRVRCPTLVIHGTRDRINAYADGKRLAELTGGTLVTLPGVGHFPQARKPVAVNLAIRDFACPPPATDGGKRSEASPARGSAEPEARPPPRRARAQKRVLYISSPIGLGHAQRDVGVARELRKLVPGVEIDWLAQDPVTRVLAAENERIHPASAHLASEARHIECESAEHDLHCFQAVRRMDEILIANFMVFNDLVRDERYDLWIADEAWDLDYYLHENPKEKRAAFAWFTDFVGWLPFADGGDDESGLTADYNAQMVEHIAAHPGLRDRALFVGNADDIVPDRLGPKLPLIRDWTEKHFEFPGYITGFDPRSLGDRAALRHALGWRDDELVCVVTVGGSGVGGALLRRVIAAYPEAKRLIPALRMLVVTGPRIDPSFLDPRARPSADGLELVAYVHNLYRHLAACDLAVVQGGLTTAMELCAAKRPFLYFPLRHHFEQSFHVRHRLERYRAGRCMDFDTATPEIIAAAIAAEIGKTVDYRDVETDGAARAAKRLAEML